MGQAAWSKAGPSLGALLSCFALGACALGPKGPLLRPSLALAPAPEPRGLAQGQGALTATGGPAEPTFQASFVDRFEGQRLNTLSWRGQAGEGRLFPWGGELVIGPPPAGGSFPSLGSLAPLWPNQGPYVFTMNYRVTGPGGSPVQVAFGAGALPPAGVEAPGLVVAKAEGTQGLRVLLQGPSGPPSQGLSTHGAEPRPATAPHRFRLEVDAQGQARVLIDGAEVVQGPLADRLGHLTMGLPARSLQQAEGGGWAEWRCSAVESGSLGLAQPSGPSPTPFPTPTPAPTPKPATPKPQAPPKPPATPSPAVPATPKASTAPASPSPPVAAASPSPAASPAPSTTPEPSPSASPSASPSPEPSPSPSTTPEPSPSPNPGGQGRGQGAEGDDQEDED